MTNEERKQWIRACKELLVKYKNGTHDTLSCPLCALAYDWMPEDALDEDGDLKEDACEYCIWSKFTQTDCMSYAVNHTTRDPLTPLMKTPGWIALRIKQLPEWIKQLEEMTCDDD